MSRSILVAFVGLLTLGACSKPAAGGGQSGSPAGTNVAAASAPAGTACDRKLVTEADIAPLLSEPIATVRTIPGDPQSCEFTTTGSSLVQISLRPGLGHTTIDEILSGKTNQTVTPLAGVGERAVWDALLKEVDAEKNGALCEISATGPATGGAVKEKIGALCNKILAAN